MFGDYTPDLRTVSALLDGQPLTCPSCGAGHALVLDLCGPRETWPARLGCLDCGHGGDHPTITNGLLQAALAGAIGRLRAKDRPTFRGEWRDHVLEGEQHAEWVPDDIVTAARELAKEGKKRTRRWARAKKREARRAVDQATGRGKASVLGVLWQARTGGAGPVFRPARRCKVRGCRAGLVTIHTRVHGDGEQLQVPCAVCHRAA
jgi:hypothetical protein